MQKIILSLTLVSVMFLFACSPDKSSETEAAVANPATPTAAVTPAPAATPAAPATAAAPGAVAAAPVSWATTEAHNFGKIDQGKPVTHRFELTNTGDAPITITDVKPTCGCTAANYTREEIPAGGSGYVEATYNAANMGAFNKTVTVRFGDTFTPVMLRLQGEVATAK